MRNYVIITIDGMVFEVKAESMAEAAKEIISKGWSIKMIYEK